MTLTEVKRLCEEHATGDLLDFIESAGLKEENGHIYIPTGFSESSELTYAINHLCNEWDYSAGASPETERVP